MRGRISFCGQLPMFFLVDGYNLLYALGMANRQMGLKGLERARFKMLDWLSEQHKDSSRQVLVVFDAKNAPRSAQRRQSHRGIQIEFAVGTFADDRIEELILEESQPKKLTVVSNDTRLRMAARREGCISWSSDDYVDFLILEPKSISGKDAMTEPEKVEDATPEELAEWLAVFETRKK